MTRADPPPTDAETLEAVLKAAAMAARPCASSNPAHRAVQLRAIADRLAGAADDLVGQAGAETHLAEGRLRSELDRTTFQLRLFGQVLEEGEFLDVTLDRADANWPPGPRPDLRRMLRPVGPVLVFAAGNFPFAFSVAGADTTSALAAGCPVVLKAHPGHRRLSELVGHLVTAALRSAGAPHGSFAVIYGDEAGRVALCDERITAASFTGSSKVGRMLFDLANSRPVPIPFYGEMGSLNPVFVTRSALARRRSEILDGFVKSFTVGAGQFCTKPGVLVVPEGQGVIEDLVNLVLDLPSFSLLSADINRRYAWQLEALLAHPAVTASPERRSGGDLDQFPTLLATTASDLLAHRDEMMVECFGPASLVVTYTSDAQLMAVATSFSGQLTATVQAEEDDPVAESLLEALADRVGRLLWNQWPTGVSVTWAMQHGGPYPATTAPGYTSVGPAAIARFLRPITYQSVPASLLPASLRDDNPLGLPRRVDGQRGGFQVATDAESGEI